MTKQEIKQEIRKYFAEQYNYCLRAFEYHFGDDTNITRTTKVFSYEKYIKRLVSLNKYINTVLEYANIKWAKDNDGSPIYIDENGQHYMFDYNECTEWSIIPEWEVDIDKWLDQKVEEVYNELYNY